MAVGLACLAGATIALVNYWSGGRGLMSEAANWAISNRFRGFTLIRVLRSPSV